MISFTVRLTFEDADRESIAETLRKLTAASSRNQDA